MIIENEILEQISDSGGWDLPRVIDFLRTSKEPWKIIDSLFRDKCIDFIDIDENKIPEWKISEAIRNKTGSNMMKIIITEIGLSRVFD